MSRPLPFVAAGAILLLAACGGTAAPAAPTAPPSAAATQAPPTAAPSEAPPTDVPASDPAGASACQPTTDPVTVEASIADFAFQPATVTAGVGDVIGWTNGDAPPHTATLVDDPACTTANLARGETGSLVFSAAGTYPFFCKIHPSMTGTIEITG